MASSSSASSTDFNETTNSELLQQIQLGFNAFWLMQRLATNSPAITTVGPQMGGGGIFPSFSPNLLSSFAVNTLDSPIPSPKLLFPPEEEDKGEEEFGQKPSEESKMVGEVDHQQQKNFQQEERVYPRPPVLDKRWEFVSAVASFVEFEQLRCQHQVSRNRTFAYGIRYSCTQKTQLRSNCPYLLVCIFADGAGETTAPGIGTITVYSRNSHTHPVKTIKRRQPRSLARQAKRERDEQQQQGQKRVSTEGKEEEEEDDGGGVLELVAEKKPAAKIDPTNSNANKDSSHVVEDGHKKLMDLLADLSQHFAAPAAREGQTEGENQ